MALSRVRRKEPAAAAVEAEPARATSASADALLNAAVSMFAAQGFHGTSMRDIAARAGSSVSHAYYYFPSKMDMLLGIMTRVIEDDIAVLEMARDSVAARPAARLAALVRAHVRLHIERQDEAFVGNSEMRSLEAEGRARIVALRDRVARIFKDVIAEGFRAGVFGGVDEDEAPRAIITMCSAVAGWYRASGRLRPEVIENRYADLCLQMVGYRGERR